MSRENPSAQDVKTRLETLGQQLHANRREHSRIMGELNQAIREADLVGMKRNEIIQLAGVARQTVYNALTGE